MNINVFSIDTFVSDVGESNVSNTLGHMNSTTAATGPDEFDMFAQSRQSFDQSTASVR